MDYNGVIKKNRNGQNYILNNIEKGKKGTKIHCYMEKVAAEHCD